MKCHLNNQCLNKEFVQTLVVEQIINNKINNSIQIKLLMKTTFKLQIKNYHNNNKKIIIFIFLLKIKTYL